MDENERIRQESMERWRIPKDGLSIKGSKFIAKSLTEIKFNDGTKHVMDGTHSGGRRHTRRQVIE